MDGLDEGITTGKQRDDNERSNRSVRQFVGIVKSGQFPNFR